MGKRKSSRNQGRDCGPAVCQLKSLIITGDDFGRSHEVNEAIERCHKAGFLTQASLMVNEPCADEAVRIAQRNPALCVGLHLTLCDGRASSVSPLTDTVGQFPSSPARCGVRYAFVRSLAEPLAHEIRAQFDRFRSFGLPPTYWDGHAHLHLNPIVLGLTIPVAVKGGFRATRVVREPGAPALLPWIFESLSRVAIPALQRHGIAFTDHVFGLRHTGHMTTDTITRILQNLPEGVSELYFHPGAEAGSVEAVALAKFLASNGITPRTSLPPGAAD
jgi:hopanoid biosynthesis associated protein HpnK